MGRDRDLPVPRNIGWALLLHGRFQDQPTAYEVKVLSHHGHCDRHRVSQGGHHHRFVHVVPEGNDSVTEGGTGDESGGGVALVKLRLTKKFNILDDDSTRLLLTCVRLTMFTTSFPKDMGGNITKKME